MGSVPERTQAVPLADVQAKSPDLSHRCFPGLPMGFSGGSDGKKKKSACNAGSPGSIPGSGRSPGAGHGNPLQYSCLENPKDVGAWRATVHGSHKESDTTERLTVSHVFQGRFQDMKEHLPR